MEELIERALMDYVLITKRMVGRLKDVHVFRGVAAGMSDHFLVEAKVVYPTHSKLAEASSLKTI